MTKSPITVVIGEHAPTDELGSFLCIRFIRCSHENSFRDHDTANAEVFVADEETIGLIGALRRLPRLRLVQSIFGGVEDLLPSIPAGVILCNASTGVHDVSVSEWVVMAIIGSLRSLPTYVEAQLNRRWIHDAPERELPSDELAGKRVLIIGYGPIGQAIEKRLIPFGAIIQLVGRRSRSRVHGIEELPELLPGSEIVVLSVPLNRETHHFVDSAFLDALPEGALIVNAGRGALIEPVSFRSALISGRIRAALDVTEPEPLTTDDPIWGAPNCLITPHVAGSTRQWKGRAYRFVGEQLRRFERGAPLENVRTTTSDS